MGNSLIQIAESIKIKMNSSASQYSCVRDGYFSTESDEDMGYIEGELFNGNNDTILSVVIKVIFDKNGEPQAKVLAPGDFNEELGEELLKDIINDCFSEITGSFIAPVDEIYELLQKGSVVLINSNGSFKKIALSKF